jgi:hypothetical protein
MTSRTNLPAGGAVALLFLLGLGGARSQPAPEPPPQPLPAPVLTAPPPAPPQPAPPDVFTTMPPAPPLPPAAPLNNALTNGARSNNPFMIDQLAGPMLFRADARATWYASAPVAGQNTNLGMTREDLSLSCPLWQGPCDGLSLSIHSTAEQISSHAFLPATGQPVPDDLWAVRFGANYRHQFESGWIAGVGASVGTASDKPFHSIDEMTAGVNAFLLIPSGERNAWLFTLAYSVNSELPIPIPGVAYVWQPSDNLRVNLGLPFQLHYRPIEDLTLDLSYMLLTNVHAQATYRLQPGLCAYTSFDWRNESYFLADRPNVNDRFFYYEKKVTAGVRWNFGKSALLDVHGGYSFDRFFFEGLNYSDHNNNRIDVGNTPFVGAQLQVRW